MTSRILFTFLTICIFSCGSIISQNTEHSNKGESSGQKPDRYAEFTRYAKTKEGLIKIHEIYESKPKMTKKIYFEVPKGLFWKKMLLSSKISETSDNYKAKVGEMQFDPKLVYFTKHEGEVRLHQVLTDNIVNPSQNIVKAYYLNNIDPILESFPIKLNNSKDSTLIFDVTNFFLSSKGDMGIKLPTPPFHQRPARLNPLKHLNSIINLQAFPNNINVKCQLNYDDSGRPFAVVVTRSFVLLPEKPMMPRMHDPRINYFSTIKNKFDTNIDKVESVAYIHRWNILPKPKDQDRFLNGELVEPAKPIVFYIDDAFPEKWRPYIKQGIEDWQVAFEEIGFKNAIIAKDFPEDDESFNPDDIRYSCVRYIPTTRANAKGPCWVDPRSGEIVQGSVYLYHNVVSMINAWRFVQTAGVDPEARKAVLSDEKMGESLRNVITHEIGHTLGLMHNFGASSAYPVDSLRSGSFTKKYGLTPSVMDYVRYNYVAQPDDKDAALITLGIGEYDKFAIKMGYKPILNKGLAKKEYDTLNEWLLDKSDDPAYFFGPQMSSPIDPNSQGEALGSDPILAAKYGIKNVKFIMDHLLEWSAIEGQSFKLTANLYRELVRQYNVYMKHATTYFGGAYLNMIVDGENKRSYVPVSKEKQKEVLQFIFDEMQQQANWMVNEDIIGKIGLNNNMLFSSQSKMVSGLMSSIYLSRIELIESNNGGDSYSIPEYLNDIYAHVWEDEGKRLNKYQRNIQHVYVTTLLTKLTASDDKKSAMRGYSYLDSRTENSGEVGFIGFTMRGMNNMNKERVNQESNVVFYAQLMRLQKELKSKSKSGSVEDRNHYAYLLSEINKIVK